MAAAKKEGKVVVYSITFRIANAATAFEKKYGIKVEAKGLRMLFTPVSGSVTLRDAHPIVIGVRPENVRIGAGSGIAGKIYSTLPSGMETIVKVQLESQLITSVVFGSVDFPIDKEVDVDFVNDSCLLFDGETGTKLAAGTLRIV